MEELEPLRLRALKRSIPPELPPPPPCKEPEPPPEAEAKEDSEEEEKSAKVAASVAPIFVLPTAPPTPPAPPREHIVNIYGFPTFPPHPDCPEPCEAVSPEVMADALKEVFPPDEPEEEPLMNATAANATLLVIRSMRRTALRGRKANVTAYRRIRH